MKQSKTFIRNKRCLVAGGAGSIGNELVRQLCIKNKVFILDIDETRTFDLAEELKEYWVHYRIGDIRNKETVKDVFSDFKPQIVINAAALKNVVPSQIYAEEYVQTNVNGNLNLINEAKNWECLEKFVFVSTDKIFSKSVMGATKKCSEVITVSMGKRFVAVRFGNVMASAGSVLEIWQKQADQRKPLTITDEKMERYMMTIPQACKLVIKAIEESEGGEVFLFKTKKIKIIDLANKIIELSDYEGGIKNIGIRPGESLKETLMSEEEEKVAIKQGDFYIIKYANL